MERIDSEMDKSSKVKKKKRVKKKFSWKLLITFIVFEIVFTGITGPLLVFYGPFENVKTTIVGSAMTTLTHQWIATTFLSQEKIDKILGKQSVETVKQDVNASDVKISKKKDDSIELEKIEDRKFNGYMMIVHDPTRVKVAMTKKKGKEGQRTSQMAKDSGAIAGVNGGSFVDINSEGKWVGTGAFPRGLIVSDGKVLHNDLGEGEAKNMMAMTKDGRLLVGKYTLDELQNLNVKEGLSFDPPLVVNGKAVPIEIDWGIAPRTAIGQREDGSILMLVVDGRTLTSPGATLQDIQKIMLKYGAVNATNLDGGSSTTMYYDGDIINNPSDSLGERTIASSVLIK